MKTRISVFASLLFLAVFSGQNIFTSGHATVKPIVGAVPTCSPTALPCVVYKAHFLQYYQAKQIIQLGRELKEITNRDQCKNVVSDAGKLSAIVAKAKSGPIVGLGIGFMVGDMGRCACDSVFDCGAGAVVVYEHDQYGGKCQAFDPGKYRADKGELHNLPNDSATSLIVTKGFRARLCENEGNGNGSGACEQFGEGSHHLRWKDHGGVADNVSFIHVWKQ